MRKKTAKRKMKPVVIRSRRLIYAYRDEQAEAKRFRYKLSSVLSLACEPATAEQIFTEVFAKRHLIPPRWWGPLIGRLGQRAGRGTTTMYEAVARFALFEPHSKEVAR